MTPSTTKAVFVGVEQPVFTPRQHHTLPILYQSSMDDLPGKNRRRSLIERIRKFGARLVSYPYQVSSKFRSLPRTTKVIVLTQMIFLCMVVGTLGRAMYFKHPYGSSRRPIELPYSRFLELVEESSTKGATSVVDMVRIGTDKIFYQITKRATPDSVAEKIIAFTRKVPASPALIQHMQENKVTFQALARAQTSLFTVLVRSALLGSYGIILWRMYRNLTGKSTHGDNPGKVASMSNSLSLASFNDIQGVDDAKLEVMELVDTLQNSDKYAVLGARAPTGLLLEGPPGTGKTMLARATAASAGIPLLYCSGSDFVEMYVGRGAARVRKLFEQAKKLVPCIIFVDELDALGKARNSGHSLLGGHGNDEAEQTLNQLLACMDGLDSSKKICVIAATNRKEILDPALTRPGRFDRIVTLDLPNAKGRENILRVHSKKLPGFKEGHGVDDTRTRALGKDDRVDLSAVAAVTPGFSGAELEYLVNEAAIRAVRRVNSEVRVGNSDFVPHVHAVDFEESLERFLETRRPQGKAQNLWQNMWGQ